MTKQHTPESIQHAIFLTLSQIQGVIYDFWNADIPWSEAHPRIQRHALELRLLQRGDLPPTSDPLRFVRTSARAIERANAARDRIRSHVQDCRFGPDQPAAGGTSQVQTTGGPDDSASGPDDVPAGLDNRPDAPRGLVQTTEDRMSYGDGTLEEGSADVEPGEELPLQVGATGAQLVPDECIVCGKPFVPGTRGIAVGNWADTGRPAVKCLDCLGEEPPRPAP
jgi:hypothetical protein